MCMQSINTGVLLDAEEVEREGGTKGEGEEEREREGERAGRVIVYRL